MQTEARASSLAGWARRRALGDRVPGRRVAAAKVPSAYTRMTARSVNAGAHRASAQRAFLIATQLLEIKLTSSQQTRKHFLIATKFDCLAHVARTRPLPFDPAQRDLRMNRAAARFTDSKPQPAFALHSQLVTLNF
jgi:hypothetical protein